MKLEDKFFKVFFYPFLAGVLLSTIVVTIFLRNLTNNSYDKRTSNNIINLEKNYSKVNINSINTLLTTSILKLQIGLNELILFYQRIANKVINSNETYELNHTFFKCALDFDEFYCLNHSNETDYTAYWLLDNETKDDDLNDISKKDVKNQLIAFSYIIPNIDTILEATKPNAECYYFHFEKTDLFTSYPLSSDCEDEFFEALTENSDSFRCIDNKGEIYDSYKFKCEPYFDNMLKSKTGIYDNNYLSSKNKTIFITNYYGPDDEYLSRELTMCIEFDDPITEGKGYICADFLYDDINFSLENLNSNIPGYFFIANVGFNHAFYFPQGNNEPKTYVENIFNWEISYKMDEKEYFYNFVRKIFSSNYLDQLKNSTHNEIFVNGKDDEGQYFFIDGVKNKYSIYPIIIDNLKGQEEHVFSIIYIYKDHLFFDKIDNYTSSIKVKIILELLLFIIFGSGLLYIIYLTFNILAKYIVIPIKNVNYMLKGINIGGENRLEYLNFLKKKQDESVEKLEKIYLLESQIDKKENEFNQESKSDLISSLENDGVINAIDLNNKNLFSDFDKKYDEESNYIEKEFRFYDFDEQLLQFRPLEIESLVETLMNLKGALYLTSGDRKVEKIIDYSNSERIFRSFKNKEGAVICQSNIGNLQSQLMEYDKAIYHLALSLQDNKLKKFIEKNLSDEFDEDDSLLNRILNSFSNIKKNEKNNKLAEKQLNNSKNNFSQKIIGILINTRYCRLIHVYYMFFKNLQKLQKSNKNININEQFMNTLFHTINYYHKILIQYIFLCYTKNDLIKIGESILDYIEFLIKFKFRTSLNDTYFLKIYNKDSPKFFKKQEFKKKIFNKIINWFNLFDDYISYLLDNTSLGDIKNIVDDYSHNLNSENNELNLESQSAFMFRINIQKSDFLKGKFSFYCGNYNDALFYFTRASKKRSIVIDGLLKKRSLKYINKILTKLEKKFENLRLKNLNMEKELDEYKKNRDKILNKKINVGKQNTNKSEKYDGINIISFGEKIENIKRAIINDISECNAKQEKDIIILIDFNIYDKKEDNLYNKSENIDLFIDETIIILNNYLSSNDRLAVLIYSNIYQIICPLIRVNEIDNNSFSKDLMNYKNNIFDENNEDKEYDIDLKDFNLGGNNIYELSQEDSYELSDNEENNYNKLKGLVKTINYINTYLKMKEEVKNEKYLIVFSDLLDMQFNEDETIRKICGKLNWDKETIFLLVCKNKKIFLKNKKNDLISNDKLFEELFLNKFGGKSEIIYFENMIKIKNILLNNNVIKDEIVYPNEIYK